ncbi:MAG: carboxymuconolactone decarboxylase family protein [Microbacteriaceae bacterium]
MTSAAPKLLPLTADECRPDVAEVIAVAESATGGAQNIFWTMARHPGLFKRYAPFGGKFLSGGKLPAADRELAILRTAHRCGSEYEWAQHERIAIGAGLQRAEIARVRDDSLDEWLSHEAALLRATDELLTQHRVLDDTWEELACHYDEKQLIELVLLVGNYAMLAGFLNTVGVQIEDDQGAMP